MTELRTSASSLLLWTAFLSSFLFFGIGENLFVLWVAAGLLLAALLLQPTAEWQRLLSDRRAEALVCLWVLAVLATSQLLVTIEPETSFAMAWLLAGAPLGYLAYAGLAGKRLLRILVVATVAVLAAVSAVRFLTDGVRAYEPLLDPNNYACLLYLVWIPLAHRFLLRAWDGAPRAALAPEVMLLAVFLIALFATKSRAGSAIVFGALVGWWALALRHRFPLKPLLLLTALAGFSYALVIVLAPDIASKFLDQGSLAEGVGVRAALNGAAWHMYLEAPLVGHGVFSFPQLYPLFRSLDDQGTAGIFVHNDYLQLMSETGLLLLVPLLVLLLATLRRLALTLLARDDRRVDQFGLAMALAAAMSHAAVNYVVYMLPLLLLLAWICAELYGPVASSYEAEVPVGAQQAAAGKGLAWSVGVLGLVAWAYLGLDVTTQVVFAGQPGPSAAEQLRSSPQKMLTFAARAQRLNGRRVTPVLGEALVNSALLEQAGAGDPERLVAIRDQFRRSLRMDPLNAFGYEQYYRFLSKIKAPGFFDMLRQDENPVDLLRRAVELDVRQADTILELLSVYDRLGASERGDAFLTNEVLPWLRLIHQTDPRGARRVLAEAGRRAQQAGDSERLAELEALGEWARSAFEPPPPHWLRELMVGG